MEKHTLPYEIAQEKEKLLLEKLNSLPAYQL